MKALLSVYNKDGIVELARRLEGLGIELIATDGTADTILKHGDGIVVKRVSEFTGMGEISGEIKIKTLHPSIHAGIATGDIGLVVVNLIPLRGSLSNMDIGGVALIRSAIKHFEKTAVIVNPMRYQPITDELELLYRSGGGLPALPSYTTRLELACEAVNYIIEYDTEVNSILRRRLREGVN